jgi:hypothetical protein
MRTAFAGWLLLLAGVAPAAFAQPVLQPESSATADEPSRENGLVRRYSVGLRLSIAPGVFFPSTGSAGFSLGLDGGYGVDLGPVVLIPGISAQGNWSSDWTVYAGLVGARLTVPLGNFGPYVETGLGYGHVGGPLNESAGGLAVRVGGGFIYFFSPTFALGVNVRYDTIVDTGFKSWTLGPTLLLSF